jgi:hypothetical protein
MSEADDDDVPIKGKFRPEMVQQAYKLYLLGRTDEQVADFFGVKRDAIYVWVRNRPEFREARKEGRVAADANVASSTYDNCHDRKIKVKKKKWLNTKDGPCEVEEEEEVFVRADSRAQQFWMQNRHPELWNKQAQASLEKEVKHEENLIELAKFMCFTIAKASKEVTIEPSKEPIVIEQKKEGEEE